MKKKAFITGISGQDGSYLAEYLLEKGYRVHGIIRRHSTPENQTTRIDHLRDSIHLDYGDVLDAVAIERLLRSIQPDEVYHLAAQSHVRISFELPRFTTDVNAVGTVNMLEACRHSAPFAKFYQACSSEMFGNCTDDDGYQRESTPMHPVSPYGCTKLFGYNFVRHYRKAYKMFASNGILFNHESPRRGSNFVSAKIIKGAKAIKNKKADHLSLGNLDAVRDWGHSKDYIRAMYLMMNHKVPDDFVIASGESHTVKEMCDYVFKSLGLDYENYVTKDKKHLRPEELELLKGDSSKARNTLGWTPEYTFNSMLDEMIKEL